MSTQAKSSRKERKPGDEKNGKLVKDALKPSKDLKHSNSGDKKKQKDNKKEHTQRKEMSGKDPLKEAVFALGGDTKDYQLVKDISESEEDESGNAVTDEDVSI
jgi:hypothetical protein